MHTKYRGGNKNTQSEMQASGGKSARKSDEIAETPMQDPAAEVTPSMKIRQRDQAKAKKTKQGKKKRLANFFGQGPCVPAPPREGTPIDAVIRGSGPKNVIFSNGLDTTSKCSNPLY